MKRDWIELTMTVALVLCTLAQGALTVWMICGGKLDAVP